jgi:hypothetical protein
MAVTINASTSAGLVQTADLSGNLVLQNNGTNALTLSSGNATLNTSNAGVTFTNSSALVNSNLNDYETGSWTPTITSLTGSITSYTSSGSYVKVGKLVSLMFNVSITNAGTAGGVMIITNLPFTTGGNNSSAGVMRENALTGINGGLVPVNTTTLYGAKYDGGNPTVTGYTWACQITYLGAF